MKFGRVLGALCDAFVI